MNPRKWLAAALLPFAVVSVSTASQPPSAGELAAYNVVQQAAIDAINEFRNSNGGLPALTPLTNLAQACREEAEATLFGLTPVDSLTRAGELGYTGSLIATLSAHGYFTADTLKNNLISDMAIFNYLTDPDAKYIGVGIAFRASGSTSDIQWCVLIGKDNTGMGEPAPPYGTTGIETTSGRAIPELANLVNVFLGTVLGNSIDGYLYDQNTGGFPPAVIEKVIKTLGKLQKKPVAVKTRTRKRVVYKLPRELRKVAKSIKAKGKLPPGVEFKRGKVVGSTDQPGVYRIRYVIKLPFEVNGKKKVKFLVFLTVR